MLAWKKRAEETCGLGGCVSYARRHGKGRRVGVGFDTYISRFALFSSSFFFASTSPAIWFFFLELGISACAVEGWRGALSHTVGHRVGLQSFSTKVHKFPLNIPIIFLVTANLRVLFCTPIFAEVLVIPSLCAGSETLEFLVEIQSNC